VTWRQVFKHVLTPVGYSYVEEDNIISIKSLQELNTEPVDTRVFVINFATAGDLSPVIAPLIDPQAGGRVQVDARRNALIISERPSRMGQIIDIIQRLDRPTEQVMIESKFVEVTNRDLFDLGVNWSSLRGYQASAELGREIEDEQTDTNESSVTRTNTRSITVPATMPSDTTPQRGGERDRPLIRTDTAVFDLDAFNVLISALESNDKIELISNPTVVTLSNTPAVIHIGDQYPIPNYRYNEEQGSSSSMDSITRTSASAWRCSRRSTAAASSTSASTLKSPAKRAR
jgi:type IV pilus assembly protein PilQ